MIAHFFIPVYICTYMHMKLLSKTVYSIQELTASLLCCDGYSFSHDYNFTDNTVQGFYSNFTGFLERR